MNATKRTTEILRRKNYRHTMTVEGPGNSQLEFWLGSKGTMIVQVWPSGNGVTTYCDWLTGSSFEQLEAIL